MSRPHVFKLTDDQRAFVELYASMGNRQFVSVFARRLGVSPSWASRTMVMWRELQVIEADKMSSGSTSLKRARGNICATDSIWGK